MKQRILILSFSHIAKDPRVMRQVRLLQSQYELHVAGFGPRPEAWGGTYHQIAPTEPYSMSRKIWIGLQMLAARFENFYWSELHVKEAKKILDGLNFELIIANDMHALPLAFDLVGNGKVIYDAHEYSPLEFAENWKWMLTLGRLNRYFCKRYLHNLSGMTTVCDGIADAYFENYGIRPRVVHNAPAFHSFEPSGLSGENIRLVHHGLALESRCLELMIQMMAYLDERFTLDFYLVVGKQSYYEKLIDQASLYKNIKFMPPVKMEDLPGVINQYDMGVYLLKPANFNSEFAMPNKFFEFVQGRVAIAVGPSPEMATLVKKYEMGVVAESFEPRDLAAALCGLTSDQLWRFKQGAHKAARELNYEQAGSVMLSEIERCLSLNAKNCTFSSDK